MGGQVPRREGAHVCSRSYCADEDEHVAREGGYVEEMGLRVGGRPTL